MKRNLLCLFAAMVTGWAAQAQLNEGGIPLSLRSALKDQYVPASTYLLPDWNATLAKSEAEEAKGKQQPYLVALCTATDVSFPGSGTFTKAENGHQVWRAQIKIDGAKAIGLYYDKFQLPKGAQLYITNANGNQILGAYTNTNNTSSGKFANEAVQGNVANIEIDIAPDVNLQNINMHIDRAAVYFRGIEYLAKYTLDPSHMHEMDGIDSLYAGGSSVCMINAICPAGVNYPNQRKASLQTLMLVSQGVVSCSATMINNTGNTSSNCKQYLLTATHCDGANSTEDSHFAQLLVRFNFEESSCVSNAIPESNTLFGANFVARASFDTNAPLSNLKGDFLLLELKEAIPAAWNVVLSGWNRNPDIATSVTLPKKFIGFHHPDGDVKKVSSAQDMLGVSLDGTTTNTTHWAVLFTEGFASTGSSGSGLFDGDGYLIGDLSAGGSENMDTACINNAAGHPTGTGNGATYSKFAYNWDYTLDGTASNRKLKPWLDPTNSGVVKLNPVKSNCTALDGGTGISINNNALDNSISIYPNPSATGIVQVKINLASASDIAMELYDVTGKKLNTFQLKNVHNGPYTIDLSRYSNGIYLLKCSDGNSVTSKKIMLSK